MILIQTTSERFGAVDFDLTGNIASQIDRSGEHYSPTRTYDESMKWILEQLHYMMQESPDLRFIP